MELRPYQKQAVQAMQESFNLPGNDILVLATGAGKSLVLADFVHKTNEPVLILQPTKEILEQNYEKLLKYIPKHEIGIFSASLERKEIKKFTLGTIESIYRKADQFKHFKLVVIDECHYLAPKSVSGMYNTLFKSLGNPKVYGLTATPYRNDTINIGGTFPKIKMVTYTQLINRVRGKNNTSFWSRIIFNIGPKELIDQGYLSPLKYLAKNLIEHSQIPLNKSGSDFDQDYIEQEMSKKEIQIVKAINYGLSVSKSVLVFCTSIKQSYSLSKYISNSYVVTGSLNRKEREKVIDKFKTGKIKVILNCKVFTTGFDFPALDCIILAHPTRSLALLYQMLGRGVRIAPNKTHCNVIDLTSTITNLGTLESIRIAKDELDMWNIFTSTGKWHNRELYSYELDLRSKINKSNRLI